MGLVLSGFLSALGLPLPSYSLRPLQITTLPRLFRPQGDSKLNPRGFGRDASLGRIVAVMCAQVKIKMVGGLPFVVAWGPLELIMDSLRLIIGLFAWSAHCEDSGDVSCILNEVSLRSARQPAFLLGRLLGSGQGGRATPQGPEARRVERVSGTGQTNGAKRISLISSGWRYGRGRAP